MATTFRLKRKTFAFLGIGNVAKNWKAAEGAFKSGNYGAGLLSGAKSIGTGALYTTAGLGAAGAIGSGIAAKKGADLLIGEGAAKQN